MFIVNGEILSQKEHPDLWAWKEAQIKEIDSMVDGDYVIFSSFEKPHYEIDDSGRRRKTKRFKSVPATSTIDNGEFGTQTWTYVPGANSVKNENGMVVPINLKPFFIGQDEFFHKVNDKEIIFFLLKISEAMKNKKLFHVDNKKTSIEEADKSAIAAEAQYMLYHASSPISPEATGSEQPIRQLAISFGVPDVSNLHIAEVRNQLWKIVQHKEKTHDREVMGYKGFIDEVMKVKNHAKRAMILTGIEKGIFRREDYKWYLSVKGSFDKPICSVPESDVKNAKEHLIKFVLDNPEYLDLLNETEKDPEKKIVTKKVDDKMDRSEMIERGAKLGWPKTKLFKMKDDRLQEIIKNEIQPE